MIISVSTIDTLAEKLGIKFTDKRKFSLVVDCLYDPSRETMKEIKKLAYVGDTVVELIVRDMIIKYSKDKQRKCELVSYLMCNELFYYIMKEEDVLGNELNRKLRIETVATIFEAIVACLYYDQGISAVKRFLVNTLISRASKYRDLILKKKPMHYLSLMCVKFFLSQPKYELTAKPPPQYEFTVRFAINGVATGTAGSHRAAKEAAAMNAIAQLEFLQQP